METATTVPHIRSLPELLSDLKAGLGGDSISIGALVEALHERGIAMLLLVFALPAMVPVPGLNTICAIPLILLTAQQAMGARAIWLPRSVSSRELDCAKLKTLITTVTPWMKRLEVLIRPRLGGITQDGPSRLFGFFGLIMALTASIPVPLTHTIPSIGIALMAIGFIMRDGLAVLGGAVIGTAWVALLFGTVFLFGLDAVNVIKEAVTSLL